MDVLAALQRAGKAFSAGDPEAGLGLLIDAWRAERQPTIADLIDAVGDVLREREPPIRGSGSISEVKAWTKALGDARPSTLSRLLEALPKTSGLTAKSRLAALTKLDHDPRTATAIVAWMREPPFDGKNRARCFPIAVELLGQIADTRALPAVAELDDSSHRAATVLTLGIKSLKPLHAAHAALRGATPRELSPAAAAALEAARSAALRAQPSAGTIDPAKLFRDVYSNPSDTRLRLVLADVLQERGDPRGEFIALQCAHWDGTTASDNAAPREVAQPSARERQLLAKYERAWLGSIGASLQKAGVEYERGFVAACRLTNKAPDESCVEWATVARLDVSRFARFVGRAAGFLGSENLRSLRELTGAGPDVLERFASEDLRQDLEVVGFALWAWEEEELALLSRLRLPRLRTLEIVDYRQIERSAEEIEAYFRATAPLPIKSLSLKTGWAPAAAAIAQASVAGHASVRMELPSSTILIWQAGERSLTVRASMSKLLADSVIQCVESLPRSVLGSVTMVEEEGPIVGAAHGKRMRAAARAAGVSIEFE